MPTTRPYIIRHRETGRVHIIDGAVSPAQALSFVAGSEFEVAPASAAEVIEHAVRGGVAVESLRPAEAPPEPPADAEQALFAQLEPMPSRHEPNGPVSLILQDLAAAVADILRDAAGKDIAFVLIVSDDKTAQYIISNTKRADGMELIEELLARWKAGRADIPAHYNPDIPQH